MLFRRRRPQNFWSRLRTAIWPRRSFARSIQYFVKRVLRLTATPHAIAAGVAAGVFASWTPLLGFHFLLAFGIAYLIAGNMVAAALGTAVGNPLTFPLMWALTMKVGNFIVGIEQGPQHPHINLEALLRHLDMSQLWEPVLKPMLIGSLPLGIACAVVFYVFTYSAVAAFQSRRRLRLAEKAKQRISNLAGGRTA